MNNIIHADQLTDFTVVVSINGGISTHALSMKNRPFEAFEGIKLYELGFGPSDTHKKNKNPKFFKTTTQLVLTKLSDADESSKNQQFGHFKWQSGNKVWPNTSAEEQITAMALSQIWDRVGGKVEGSSFTFTSPKYSFTAVFDYTKNKYIIQ